MNDTIANKAVTEAQAAYKAMLEAHDAAVRQEVITEVRASLDDFFSQLEAALLSQLNSVRAMRGKLMDKPAPTPAKRKRSPTVATDEQVALVRETILKAEQFTNGPLLVKTIAGMAHLGPRITTNACKQLEAQGWVKGVDNGYRWIPEEEAGRENGPIVLGVKDETDQI